MKDRKQGFDDVARAIRRRKVPLAPRVTEEDRAAHRAFVLTLGDKPIWNDFLALTTTNHQRTSTSSGRERADDVAAVPRRLSPPREEALAACGVCNAVEVLKQEPPASTDNPPARNSWSMMAPAGDAGSRK